MHDILSKEKNYVGIDILEGNWITCDVEEMNKLKLGKFDIVLAGELIEHLFNPGKFLDNCKLFMKYELLLTTPNCFSIRQLFREKVRTDHTCWYSYKTLRQLLELKGFKVSFKYYKYHRFPLPNRYKDGFIVLATI